MSGAAPRRVLVVVPDLFFAVRIATTAEALGVALEQLDLDQALARCTENVPDLVILDLHAPGDPVALVRSLKARDATRHVRIIGFYSHVDQALREAALAAGVDDVLPRSAFTMKLAGILKPTA